MTFEQQPWSTPARDEPSPRTASCPFDQCDGSGFLVDEQTNTAHDCSCRAGRVAMRRAASLEGRIPKLYRGAWFDRPPVLGMPERVVSSVRRYVGDIHANIESGRGLWLVGDVGTGKTTLAMIASKSAIQAGFSVAIYSLPRLLNLIRDEVGTDNSLLNLLDRLSSVDLLHIDDLGAQHTTPWRLEQLYSIIDARYQAQRAVIVTANLMPDELSTQMAGRSLGGDEARAAVSDRASELVGKRIVSRLIEMCGDPLPLFGDDQRLEYRLRAAPARAVTPSAITR